MKTVKSIKRVDLDDAVKKAIDRQYGDKWQTLRVETLTEAGTTTMQKLFVE